MLALHPVLDSLRAPLPLIGVLDWSAHLATAVLILANLGPLARPAVTSALVASLVLDLDHLPHYLGSPVLTAGSPRPYTHSLAAVAVACLVAARLQGDARRRAAGVALGILAHLTRDLATGGVPLLWPLTREGVAVPFWLYAALAGALAARAWLRVRARESRGGDR